MLRCHYWKSKRCHRRSDSTAKANTPYQSWTHKNLQRCWLEPPQWRPHCHAIDLLEDWVIKTEFNICCSCQQHLFQETFRNSRCKNALITVQSVQTDLNCLIQRYVSKQTFNVKWAHKSLWHIPFRSKALYGWSKLKRILNNMRRIFGQDRLQYLS